MFFIRSMGSKFQHFDLRFRDCDAGFAIRELFIFTNWPVTNHQVDATADEIT